ncbi:30S ribosomal protein S18 [candidate division WOR_3 bacterium SM23_60]|uniref:Small ribosomal subunit protein bS18 n=1 Tax=candidate division WOR_3 bacterium SM23_60 TaxID=1703780 RepID=A0A0S8GCC7_UNCW3|nr:MAG: 30S ribosomal protein S18 [candidate division WOR_3 bacterium SM23_60]
MKKRRRCRFCKNKVDDIDYKDTSLLKGFINERGKILSSRITKLCSFHQRRLTQAIKRAREIALLPYEIK